MQQQAQVLSSFLTYFIESVHETRSEQLLIDPIFV